METKLLPAVAGTNSIYCMDLFDLCAALPRQSVDLILADLPYQTTQNIWDVLIPFDPMWKAFTRITKPGAPIVLTASQPFTSQLVVSNMKLFRYEWIWRKSQATGFLDANRKPMKQHESILVFCDGRAPYYPQMSKGEPYKSIGNGRTTNYGKFDRVGTVNESGDRYPKTVIDFDVENGLHPTQKSTELFSYLIRTYTRPGELVFDPTCGSGTTAIAARAEGRRFICGDQDAGYVQVARDRLAAPYTPMFPAMLDSA